MHRVRRARGVLGFVLAAGLVCGAYAVACGGKKGGLVLAIDTDMKAPKDVNIVTLSVLVNNIVKVNYLGRVTPDGEVLLPATVALTEPDDPNASIRIRAVAFQERAVRVLRDVRTTIPKDGRIALLRLPLNFVNLGGSGTLPAGTIVDSKPVADASLGTSDLSMGFGAGEFDPYIDVIPTCPIDQTLIDGECKSDLVDSATLPDYAEALVGSGKPDDKLCFDTRKCLANAQTLGESSAAPADAGTGERDFTVPLGIALDPATCTLALNGTPADQLNLALQTPTIGECVAPGRCFVPLDNGPEGWSAEGDRVSLPKYVCNALRKNAALRLAYASDPGCKPKKVENPLCAADAPSDAGARDGAALDGGSVDTQAVRVISAEYPTSLVIVNGALYFAGAEGVQRVNLPTTNAATTLALPPVDGGLDGGSPPTGRQPWFMTPRYASTGGAVDGFMLSSRTWSEGYTLEGDGGVVGQAVRMPGVVGGGPAGTTSQQSPVYAWGAEPRYVAFTSEGSVQLTGAQLETQNLSFLAGTWSGYYYGATLADGGSELVACAGTANYCAGTRASLSGRIEGTAAAPDGKALFVLTTTNVSRVPYSTAGFGGPEASLLVSAAPLENTYRRAITSSSLAPGCIFFSTPEGVWWASTDLQRQGKIHSAAAALGLAVGQASGAAAPSVYFALSEPKNGNGGIWRAPVPADCAKATP